MRFAALLLLVFAIPQHQSNNWPVPPAPAEARVPSAPAPQKQVHADPDQLQREAKELLQLSEAIQPDVESVRRGLLPKDTVEKLKRIEKLSKQLRTEITR